MMNKKFLDLDIDFPSVKTHSDYQDIWKNIGRIE